MEPVVYIDILFLLNFFMNTAILFATAVFLRKEFRIIRLFCTSAISALYSVIMFFPQMSPLYLLFFKLLFWILTSYIAFPSKRICELLKNSLTFLAVNLIFGGIIFSLIFATDFGTSVGSVVSNGEIFLDIGFGTLFISAALAYSVVLVISYIKKQNIQAEKITAEITIFFDGAHITSKALCDTGCSLTDPVSGYPAIIISPHTAATLFHGNEHTELPLHKYRALPFSTISEKSGVIHGFLPDSIIINGAKTTKAVIGIAETDLGEYPLIFNPDLLNNKTL